PLAPPQPASSPTGSRRSWTLYPPQRSRALRRPKAPPEPAASPTGQGHLHSSPVLPGFLVVPPQPATPPQAARSPRDPGHSQSLSPSPELEGTPRGCFLLHASVCPHSIRHPRSLSPSPQARG
ncbi:unnamed protein product, partial [Gulo gulo]